METSAQIHVPVALPPRTEHPEPLDKGTQWVPEPVWMLSRSMKSLDHVEKTTANPRPSSLYPTHSQARYTEYESVRRFAAINLLIHRPKSAHCRQVAVDASSYK
jgi:hypothetical protein